jgi:hypothetical protein
VKENLDDWGRTLFDHAPDATRAQLKLRPFGSTGIAEDVAYPNFDIWAALDDDELVSDIDLSSEMKWDNEVDWWSRTLPFFPDARLLMAKHRDWPKLLFVYFLERDGQLYRLDGSSPPIHEFNAKHRLDLSGDNAVHYLQFFCYFVRGEEGPFYVIYKRNAEYKPTFSDEQLKHHERLDDLFQAPRVWGEDENGNIRCSALIYYSNAVFVADFLIQANGMVDMIDDQRIMAELPVKIDAPLRG